MSDNPIIAAVEAGHFQREVGKEESKHDPRRRIGDLYCRTDDELMPCSTIMAARAANARRLEAQSRVDLMILTIPTPPVR